MLNCEVLNCGISRLSLLRALARASAVMRVSWRHVALVLVALVNFADGKNNQQSKVRPRASRA